MAKLYALKHWFNSAAPTESSAYDSVLFAWPMYRYQIRISEFPALDIDVLSQTILLLFHQLPKIPQQQRSKKVAELLGFHEQIILSLTQRLFEDGYLTEALLLSTQGLDFISDNPQTNTPDWTVGYVFQPVFGGPESQLYPMIALSARNGSPQNNDRFESYACDFDLSINSFDLEIGTQGSPQQVTIKNLIQTSLPPAAGIAHPETIRQALLEYADLSHLFDYTTANLLNNPQNLDIRIANPDAPEVCYWVSQLTITEMGRLAVANPFGFGHYDFAFEDEINHLLSYQTKGLNLTDLAKDWGLQVNEQRLYFKADELNSEYQKRIESNYQKYFGDFKLTEMSKNLILDAIYVFERLTDENKGFYTTHLFAGRVAKVFESVFAQFITEWFEGQEVNPLTVMRNISAICYPSSNSKKPKISYLSINILLESIHFEKLKESDLVFDREILKSALTKPNKTSFMHFVLPLMLLGSENKISEYPRIS